MPETYPYTISNNKLEGFFKKIQSAAKPDRLSIQVLKHWGFTASDDRALIPISKGLGLLDDNGTPTDVYDEIRGSTNWRFDLGRQIMDLYSDLYATNMAIHNAPDEEIKGALSRITGKDAGFVARYFATFKALTALAKFDGKSKVEVAAPPESESNSETANTPEAKHHQSDDRRTPSFHYNIQIHLPATTDISVYNAIFKSLKDHLNI